VVYRNSIFNFSVSIKLVQTTKLKKIGNLNTAKKAAQEEPGLCSV
jgi:hypothetical protein